MIKSLDILTASILIVDDQDANITLLEHMLGGAGYVSITSTKNPLEVCELHRQNRYSLILLDLQMPGMDGFQVMENLKAIEDDGYLPVLVITAQPGHKLRALKAGARDFVSKPIDLAEVLMRVHNMIEVRLLHLETKKLYTQVVEAQKKSEQLMLIFRSGPGCVSISTVSDGRIIDANEEYCRFYGYRREELVGHNVIELHTWVHPEDRTAIMQRLLKEGTIRNLELKKRRKSGEERDILGSLELIKMAGVNEPVAIFMFTDITERKLAEASLRASEARYRSLFNTMEEGFCVIELMFDHTGQALDYRFLEANPSFARQSGLEDAMGKTARELMPEIEAHWIEIFGKVALTGESTRFVNQAKALNRWFDVCAFQIGQTAERKVAVLFTDITGRKTAEDTLRTSEERFRALFDLGPVAVYSCDASGAIQEFNRHAVTLWGRTPKSAETEERFCGSFKLYLPDGTFVPHDQCAMAMVLKGEIPEVTDMEVVCERPDGKRLTCIVNIVALKNSEGDITGAINCFYDITDRKHLENQLRQSQKMDAVGQLAGGIAHDFNNILGAIMGYTELAKLDVTDNPELRGYLDEVSTASNRAVDLVKQILTFSRRQEQVRKTVQLNKVILEALKLLRAATPKTIAFQINLAETATVLADVGSIHQVIMNLGTNAAYAMKRGAGTLKIELGEMEIDADFAKTHPELKPGRYVKLAVSDTGDGMDRDTVQRIFEPFFTTKPAGEGTGLGLSVIHGIMKSHDGGIQVYSQPGKGTTFQLYFPVFGGAALELPVEPPPIPLGHGERILFVDDEPPLVDFGKRILERLGYVVTTKTSVTEAIEAFRHQPEAYDLVVTDLTMPVMDGTHFARKLLEVQPRLPIILTTGFSGTTTPEIARQLGFRELLIKPNTARSLGETVHRVLEDDTRFTKKSAQKSA